MTSHRRRPKTQIDLELLEDRKLLAAFGTPWPEARALSISFPADETAISNQTNNINATLDTVAARTDWQELALRAFQTWSYHADINVGLRNDHGIDFGAAGRVVADPRFGDFRIGAFPQADVLANVIPFQATAGTYSGDLFLNSNEDFQYHDWANDIGPDPANTSRDLFSVVLHESGNALGLADSALDYTVMFGQYTTPKGVLTQDDIDRIQALYGSRTDPYESQSNDQVQVATLVSAPVGFQPDADVIHSRGSLLNETDVDYYELQPLVGHDSVTIRLQTAGISLLTSKLEVVDAAGNVLANSQAESVFDNDHGVQITGLQDDAALYLKVSSVNQGVYSFGDYQLQVDYRTALVQSQDPVASHYDSGADSLFANFSLIDQEQGDNDAIADAAVPIALPGFAEGRFEFESSVSSDTDVDYWKVAAPATVSGPLAISLAGVGLDQPGFKIRVVDANGQPVGAGGRLLADGSWKLQVAQPQAGDEFYLRVSVDPNSTVGVGNYVATAEFTTPVVEMQHLASGDTSSDMDDFYRWTVNKSKLFRFDLNSFGGLAGEGVRLTIYDAFTKEVRLIVKSPTAATRTAFAWLMEGDYIVRFSAISQSNVPVANINYSVTFDGISDDQDPDDSTDDDESESSYTYYEYQYDPGAYDPGYYEDLAYSYDYDYYYAAGS